MKRRVLLSLGLGGLGLAAGKRYLPALTAQLRSGISAQTNSTLTAKDALFHFVAVGDVGTGKGGQYSVARAMSQRWQASPFSLALLTGDNIYENGEIEKIDQVFERPYESLLKAGVTFRATLGNHDVRTNSGNDEVAYASYNMPARYYTFTEKTVQFFALDTNPPQSAEDSDQAQWREQLQWLRTALAGSSAPWKVVYAHHPVYSSGRHGSDPQLAIDLSPIFAEYGVQLYINGHDHDYERTLPIDGTTYITCGNGAQLRPVEDARWTAYASSQLGFCDFDIYRDRIVISAVDTHNQVYDQATLTLA